MSNTNYLRYCIQNGSRYLPEMAPALLTSFFLVCRIAWDLLLLSQETFSMQDGAAIEFRTHRRPWFDLQWICFVLKMLQCWMNGLPPDNNSRLLAQVLGSGECCCTCATESMLLAGENPQCLSVSDKLLSHGRLLQTQKRKPDSWTGSRFFKSMFWMWRYEQTSSARPCGKSDRFWCKKYLRH